MEKYVTITEVYKKICENPNVSINDLMAELNVDINPFVDFLESKKLIIKKIENIGFVKNTKYEPVSGKDDIVKYLPKLIN